MDCISRGVNWYIEVIKNFIDIHHRENHYNVHHCLSHYYDAHETLDLQPSFRVNVKEQNVLLHTYSMHVPSNVSTTIICFLNCQLIDFGLQTQFVYIYKYSSMWCDWVIALYEPTHRILLFQFTFSQSFSPLYCLTFATFSLLLVLTTFTYCFFSNKVQPICLISSSLNVFFTKSMTRLPIFMDLWCSWPLLKISSVSIWYILTTSWTSLFSQSFWLTCDSTLMIWYSCAKYIFMQDFIFSKKYKIHFSLMMDNVCLSATIIGHRLSIEVMCCAIMTCDYSMTTIAFVSNARHMPSICLLCQHHYGFLPNYHFGVHFKSLCCHQEFYTWWLVYCIHPYGVNQHC